MQITITGPRGGGNTTIAVEITKLLRSKGMEVGIVTQSRSRQQELERLCDEPPVEKLLPGRAVILDGFEPEDESSTRRLVKHFNNPPGTV